MLELHRIQLSLEGCRAQQAYEELHLLSIRSSPLPRDSLLASYETRGAYTDCFATDVAGSVSHEQFVTAFYTTTVFKLERWILRWAVKRPSTDAQAAQLAAGLVREFAAWHVENRAEDQVLLSDFVKRTRSWLMVAPTQTLNGPGTRLYFGSAIVPTESSRTGKPKLGRGFRPLLRFHKIYSVILLHAAKSRLERSRSRGH